MKNTIAALAALSLQACHHTADEPKTALVDVSEKKLSIYGKDFEATTARRGTGNAPGSYKTPLGEHVIIDKWAPGDPRYHGSIKGYKLHLAGADTPASRRIYIHKGKMNGNWSRGCVHLGDKDMETVFNQLPVGSKVIIQP